MLNLTSRRCFNHLPRKMKVAHLKYNNVPAWMQQVNKDPFDYPLQTREQVEAQIRHWKTEGNINVTYEFNHWETGDQN